jgi:hypothetical protein
MRLRSVLVAVTLAALCAPAQSDAAITTNGAVARAAALPIVKRELREHPHAFADVSGSARSGWNIGYYAANREFLVVVVEPSGRVLGAYTGFKVGWQEARGAPGPYGKLDALYIWLPLSLLFVAPFFDWRAPRRLINLDLFALSFFSVSFAFFNHADIYASVPLSYPPLLYLLGRLLWIGLSRKPQKPLRLNVPVRWLAVALVLLVGGRIAFNVLGSNVIDVGYANVVGAHRIELGRRLYGSFPASVSNGDTYGPVSYEAYVPFVELLGVGTYPTDVPAAHGAAIAFDLICIALLFLLGRRIRGPDLGIVLAYAWVAYPFTALALESNSNDALVAALVLLTLLFAQKPAARGVFGALAGLTKFAPLALAPLLFTHRIRETGRRGVLVCVAAFAVAAVLASEPGWVFNSLDTIYSRTVGFQAQRKTPFALWGLYGGLGPLQTVVQLLAIGLAVAVALVPRREDLIGLAACAAAVLVAVQLGTGYWFYLYIPWFFAPALLALLAGGEQQLLDSVGAQRLRAGHEHTHQPGVLVSG